MSAELRDPLHQVRVRVQRGLLQCRRGDQVQEESGVPHSQHLPPDRDPDLGRVPLLLLRRG